MTGRELEGRRVLVTRALDDAMRWALRLAAVGALPEIMPCVSTERIDDAGTRAHLVEALRDADCLLVTSVRGVQAVAAATTAIRAGVEVATVGELTATAAGRSFTRAPFVARGGTSRALGEELVAAWGASASGRRVVVAGAEGGREDADTALAAAGATVMRINVYRTIPAPAIEPRRDLSREGRTDVLLASPSAVTGLLNRAVPGMATRLFTIGPTTSAAVVGAGLVVTGQAATPDLEGLMEAMRCVTGT